VALEGEAKGPIGCTYIARCARVPKVCAPEIYPDRQAAEKDKKLRFTALQHRIYNLDTLRKAYFSETPWRFLSRSSP
jgi:hypothetical protein